MVFRILVAGFLLFLLLIRFQAPLSYADPLAPVVDTVITTTTSGGPDSGGDGSTGHVLVEAVSTVVYVRGSAHDDNGCEDIDSASNWQTKVFRTGVTNGSNCTQDQNNCYNPGVSTLTFTGCTGPGDLSLDYEFNFNIAHFADPTDAGAPLSADTWTSRVVAGDEGAPSLTSVPNTDIFEVAGTIALEMVTSSVNYGAVGFGMDSPPRTLTVRNSGNRAIDFMLTADKDLDCPAGSVDIPSINVHFGNPGFTYGGAGDLTTSGIPVNPGTANINANIPQRTNDESPLDTTYDAILRMIDSGIRSGANCSNTLTFTAGPDV